MAATLIGVGGESLQDPAGYPPGHFRPVVSTGQRRLEDLPPAGGIGAGEARDSDVQAGGEPHHRQIDESTSDVIPLDSRVRAVRAGVGDGHRGRVDDSERGGVGSNGYRQTEFRSPADSVGDEVANSVHF